MEFIKWWCIIYNIIMAMCLVIYIENEEANIVILYLLASNLMSMACFLSM